MFEPAKENFRQLDDLAEESDYAHGLLMYAYGSLPYMNTTQTDVATDDAVSNAKSNAYMEMAAYGSWQSDNDPMSQWVKCKGGIQYVNLFLTIVDKTKWAPSAESKQQMFTDRLKGEAFALRALLYYYLLQAHGGYADDGILYGVPLLTTPEDGSSDFNQPRATFTKCVQQCFADCDSALMYLPYEYIDVFDDDEIPAKYRSLGANYSSFNLVFGYKAEGLMSAKIVEAVKAQIALLAASPAFREQSGVTSADAASLCAIVLKHNGGLDGFDPTGNIWYKNTSKLGPGSAEMPEILWRESREDGHNNSSQEADNFPPSLYGNGRVNPSQNLVDAFPMRNGLPITDPASGYNPQDPYLNRDPRLSDYIIYNGTTFRRIDIITGYYANSKGEFHDNVDKLPYQSTRTGYYLKKLLRDDVAPAASGSEIKQWHVYPRIRYTEIFLAYAEAANDAWGPKADPTGIGFTAYDVIKAIRQRAGLGTNEIGQPLPEGDVYLEACAADKTLMTNLIRNERRLELCFENKRFWDLRRWMLPINEPIRGMEITRIEETGILVYKVKEDVEKREFDSSYQWFGPIPKSEVLKFSNLKQNKGWY
jgi:hypothetical protein